MEVITNYAPIIDLDCIGRLPRHYDKLLKEYANHIPRRLVHWSENMTIGKFFPCNLLAALLASYSKCISWISKAQNAIIPALFSNANNNNFICPLHSCAYMYIPLSTIIPREQPAGIGRRGAAATLFSLVLLESLGGNVWKIVKMTMDERKKEHCAVWANTMQAKVHLINPRKCHWRHCYRPCAVCHAKCLLSDLSVCFY